MPGVTKYKKAAEPSKPSAEPSSPDEQQIRAAIEAALHIYPNDTLPRGVERLEGVSVSKSEITRILVRWAVNDWIRWAGGYAAPSLEAGAKADIRSMLGAIASTDIPYDKVEFEGTLPIETENGDSTEGVVIKAVFNRSSVERYKAELPHVTVDLEAIKTEKARRNAIRPENADVLSFAEDKWIRPELSKAYR